VQDAHPTPFSKARPQYSALDVAHRVG
jgi:hypothetical protein